MKIENLADYPELIPTLASWFFNQWGHILPGDSVEAEAADLQTRLNYDQVPLTLIAFYNDIVVGTATLRPHSLSRLRMDLSPWLADVYVPMEYRGKGIGNQLVSAAEEKAKQLGFDILYLYTTDKREFYEHLGWFVLEDAVYQSERVFIMQKQLSKSTETNPYFDHDTRCLVP